MKPLQDADLITHFIKYVILYFVILLWNLKFLRITASPNLHHFH